MSATPDNLSSITGGRIMQARSTRFTQQVKAVLVGLSGATLLALSLASQANSNTVSVDSGTHNLQKIDQQRTGQQRILLFSKTAGFTHGSIPAARSAIRSAAEQAGFAVDTSNDASLFNATDLANYAAVVFLMTSGNILNNAQQDAFEAYIQAGNGYAGVHSASDTEYQWPWYGDLVGAYFNNHPSIQQATINIEDASHPSTEGLDDPWVRTDEWYNFQTNPRGSVTVLATLDESTYNGGNMGDDHPIAWYHDYDGGRSWYTAGGHTNSSYSDPDFIAHILGGIIYAAGTVTDIDTDGDSVFDAEDNCQTIANEDQRDTDNDGFGNICDADLNGDCNTNFQDLAILSDVFLSNDADSDLNGDGAVNFLDVNIFGTLFLSTPGPSGTTDCVN